MPRQEGAHEFVKTDTHEVWECKHCGMSAVTDHFNGVETLPCTYGRDHNFDEDEE